MRYCSILERHPPGHPSRSGHRDQGRPIPLLSRTSTIPGKHRSSMSKLFASGEWLRETTFGGNCQAAARRSAAAHECRAVRDCGWRRRAGGTWKECGRWPERDGFKVVGTRDTPIAAFGGVLSRHNKRREMSSSCGSSRCPTAAADGAAEPQYSEW